MEKYFGFKEMPVIYFTQLLALAFGLSDEKIRFDLNEISPVSLLEKTGILVKES